MRGEAIFLNFMTDMGFGKSQNCMKISLIIADFDDFLHLKTRKM